jgi:hypothetical protein
LPCRLLAKENFAIERVHSLLYREESHGAWRFCRLADGLSGWPEEMGCSRQQIG